MKSPSKKRPRKKDINKHNAENNDYLITETGVIPDDPEVQGEFIIKIQRSLDPGPETVLVYNRNRALITVLPMTGIVRELFRRSDALKIYCWASLIQNHNTFEVNLIRKADDQNW